MNTYDIAGMVEHYYKTAGITPDPKTCAGLVNEEFDEWADEANPYFYPADFVEGAYTALDELKELADLTYVIFGYAQSRGWSLNEAVSRVHANNLARMFQDDGTLKRNEAGKIVKNPNTPKCDLKDLT